MTGSSPPCRPRRSAPCSPGPPGSAAAPAGTIETAAYLTAKASVLERIAAERAAGGWTPADIAAARQAAARAREAADTAALLAAAGITAMKED